MVVGLGFAYQSFNSVNLYRRFFQSTAVSLASKKKTAKPTSKPKKAFPKPSKKRMKIAVEGCCHGELDAIYREIENLEAKNKYQVELLLICGDFQAIRNHRDLQCMAVPDKYKRLGEFHKYYTGEKVAPILTIVIGGNHEASNYMWELYHGGWLAPNIYFLGHAGCVQVNGIRIAGASGIFNAPHFPLGSYEKVPYDRSAVRSIYHTREYSIRKLSLLSSPPIFLSHDWPQSIEQHGDLQGLLRSKPFFRTDIQTGNLGSPPLMGLLRTLKPQWWFSAHLHVKFEATVVHSDAVEVIIPAAGQNPDEITIDDDEFEEVKVEESTDAAMAVDQSESVPKNPDEIILDDEEEDVIVPPPPSRPQERRSTKFLALDKCLPRRKFLEVVDVPIPAELLPLNVQSGARRWPTLTFDPEWLAITRAFHPWLSTTRSQSPFPDEAKARAMVQEELEWVNNNIKGKNDKKGLGMPIKDCQKFVLTAPGPGAEGKAKNEQPPWYTNPQTEAFCNMLQLENKINPPPAGVIPRHSTPPAVALLSQDVENGDNAAVIPRGEDEEVEVEHADI